MIQQITKYLRIFTYFIYIPSLNLLFQYTFIWAETEVVTGQQAGVMIRGVGIMIMGVGTMRLTVGKLGMGMVNNFRDLRRTQRTLIPVMRRLKWGFCLLHLEGQNIQGRYLFCTFNKYVKPVFYTVYNYGLTLIFLLSSRIVPMRCYKNCWIRILFYFLFSLCQWKI